MTKEPGKKVREFCLAFIETMDIDRAAREAGITRSRAMELLEDSGTVELLDKYRQLTGRQICADDAVRRLAELAFGSANDCVKLVMEEDPDISSLRLDLLSELKRGSNGTVEIKLLDRVKALERLLELLGGTSNEAESFFRALEDAGGMDVQP